MYAAYDTQVSFELRGASPCGARWSRVAIDELRYYMEFKISLERQLWTPYGYSRTHYYTKNAYTVNGGTWWTAMVDNTADDRFRSCLHLGDTQLKCTAWVE